MTKTEELQRRWYTETAARYEDMQRSTPEHWLALEHILGLARQLSIRSVLDVGAGTGRALRFLRQNGLDACGIEPVPALIEVAVRKNAIPAEKIICGQGESLPYPDAAFDAVYETGVLHHVREPNRVVREMTRVARRAVFLYDENRFGTGSPWLSGMQVLLAKLRLDGMYNYVRTCGRGYVVCPEDGLRFSYSVYSAVPVLSAWADRILFLPTRQRRSASWFQPLLTASHILICAVRDEERTGWHAD